MQRKCQINGKMENWEKKTERSHKVLKEIARKQHVTNNERTIQMKEILNHHLRKEKENEESNRQKNERNEHTEKK